MSFQKLNRIPLQPSVRNSINMCSLSNNPSDLSKENLKKISQYEQTSKDQKISQNEEKFKHNCQPPHSSNSTRFPFSPLKKENILSLSIIEGKQKIALNRLNDISYDDGISTFEDSLLKGSICKHKKKELKRGIHVDTIDSNNQEAIQDKIENSCQAKSHISTINPLKSSALK